MPQPLSASPGPSTRTRIHTVTVEFYDREFHRDFHFTDPWMYDKACLNEHGALFSCPPHAAGEGGDEEPAHHLLPPARDVDGARRAVAHQRLPAAGESVVALAPGRSGTSSRARRPDTCACTRSSGFP